MKLGEAMYKAAQEAEAAEASSGGASDGQSSSQSSDETVVDADFEDVSKK
jgi:hypothetical protein